MNIFVTLNLKILEIKDFIQYLGTDKEVEFNPSYSNVEEWIVGKVVGIDLECEHIKIEHNNHAHWQLLKFQLTSKMPVEYRVRHKVESANGHILYTKNDPHIPSILLDDLGNVTLSMCKVCGKAEVNLNEPCIKR